MKEISNRIGLFLVIAIMLCCGTTHAGTVTISGNQILFDGEPIKLIGVRCSNALISDKTTDDLIGVLDLYQSYGLNTVSVFVMGSRFGDVKGYRPDGSMEPVYLDRMEKILDATQTRNMVMIVGCLYWSTSTAKLDLMDWTQEDANAAIAGTAKWLREKGYRHVILDPDNEGMAGREMKWETEPMVQAAQAANPSIPVANNTKKPAPSADLNMHFGLKIKGKPWLDSESTPGKTPESIPGSYWGAYSKESHQADQSFNNYSRIGLYTEEMKQAQFEETRQFIENYNGILLASTWLQCAPDEGIHGPFVELGGMSRVGSNDDTDPIWNRKIDKLHPDAGVRWWFEFVRENYGVGTKLIGEDRRAFKEQGAKQLSLYDGERRLMTYNAAYVPSPDPNTPWFGRSGFIHPVYTPKGRVVTDGFPLDHMHQHGLMFAWTSAVFDDKPVDFWNSKKQQGRVEHVKTLHADKDSMTVQLQHVIDRGNESLVVLKETWNLNRVRHESMHVFDLASTQTCVTDKPLDIRKYHYGAMCIRGPLHWNTGDVMLTSEGKGQGNGNHSRPHWVAMFGDVDGEPCGIAAMSHPENFRAPQPVRLHPQMPYFCFAPMVLGEFQLEPSKDYVSRFRFVAFDGKPNPKQLNLIWQAFVKREKTQKK